MKKELIEQWELYKEVIDRLIDEGEIGWTNRESWFNFHDFMIWLETGRLNNGMK